MALQYEAEGQQFAVISVPVTGKYYESDTTAPAMLLSLADAAGNSSAIAQGNGDGQAATSYGQQVNSRGYLFNGTTWDRAKKPSVTGRLVASAATTNATLLKASAGDVFKIVGENTVASKRYLKLYNKASAPTVGTDIPVATLPLLASSGFSFALTEAAPMYFSNGIAFAITANAADSDTTAIAAGDIAALTVFYA